MSVLSSSIFRTVKFINPTVRFDFKRKDFKVKFRLYLSLKQVSQPLRARKCKLLYTEEACLESCWTRGLLSLGGFGSEETDSAWLELSLVILSDQPLLVKCFLQIDF